MFEDEKKEGVGLSYFLKEKGRLQMGNKSTANKGAAIEMCKAKNPAWQKPRLSEGNITGPLAKAQRPHTCPPVTTSLCAPTRQGRGRATLIYGTQCSKNCAKQPVDIRI